MDEKTAIILKGGLHALMVLKEHGGIGDAGNDAETCAFGAQPLGQLRHLGSDVGGERAATMYGLLETAKRAA